VKKKSAHPDHAERPAQVAGTRVAVVTLAEPAQSEN